MSYALAVLGCSIAAEAAVDNYQPITAPLDNPSRGFHCG